MSSSTRDEMPAELRQNRLRIYRLELKFEFLKLWRMPMFVVPTIVFPLLFYVVFGLTFSRQFAFGGIDVPTYMLATYGAFGIIGISVFGFGTGIAGERASGWLVLKRASPMPPEAFFIAKMGMAIMSNFIMVLALFILGTLIGGSNLSVGQWLSLGGVLVAGAIPFSTFGFAMGYTLGARSASPVTGLIHMPLSFASGLWVPLDQLPELFQNIAVVFPYYHFAQLALKQIGASYGEDTFIHLAVLLGYSLLFFGIAMRGYKRDQGLSAD